MTDPSPQDIPIRPDGLQLDEQRGFQRAFWRAERAAWVAGIVLILAALAGLFGGGGLFGPAVTRFDWGEIRLAHVLRTGRPETLWIYPRRPVGLHLPCAPGPPAVVIELPGAGGACPEGPGLVAHEPLHLRIEAEAAGRVDLPLRVDGVPVGLRLLILP